MFDEMAVLPVDGDEVARPGDVQHQFEFFLVGVSGYVNFRDLLVEDLSATPIKMIDNVGYGFFIAGNEFG